MKERYRAVKLGTRDGMFYCKDTETGSRTSLKTKDRKEAERLVRHKNEALKNPHIIRWECKCYAGMLGTFRAGHRGYADAFHIPKLYPGRMVTAANWGLPTEKEIEDKPWLAGLPRLIFVSDMGDALSNNIPFEYLRREIIDNVSSLWGRRHIWLWLSKRPARMASFGQWLAQQGIAWPENLMAMTTVTEQRFATRIDELRQVPSKLKGLSLEPLSARVNLDLRGIDWVIVGGGSDILANAFQVEWAIRCRSLDCALSSASAAWGHIIELGTYLPVCRRFRWRRDRTVQRNASEEEVW